MKSEPLLTCSCHFLFLVLSLLYTPSFHEEEPARNSKGHFVNSASPPSSLATLSVSRPLQPSVLAPLVAIRPSRPASPAAKPSFYFSTLPVSTAESSLPSRDPSDCAALSARPSTSTSATTHHAIIVRPRPPSHLPFSLLYHQSPTDCRRHSIINRRQFSSLQPPVTTTTPASLSTSPAVPTSTIATAPRQNNSWKTRRVRRPRGNNPSICPLKCIHNFHHTLGRYTLKDWKAFRSAPRRFTRNQQPATVTLGQSYRSSSRSQPRRVYEMRTT